MPLAQIFGLFESAISAQVFLGALLISTGEFLDLNTLLYFPHTEYLLFCDSFDLQTDL